MRVRYPDNISSNYSGPSCGSGSSRCLARPASPAAGGVFPPGNLPVAIISAPAVAPEAFYVGDTEGICMPGRP